MSITDEWTVTTCWIKTILFLRDRLVVHFLGQYQQTGSRNMADFQHIKCKRKQRKTSLNHRNFALYKEIGSRNQLVICKILPKVINGHFCASALKMSPEIALNATNRPKFKGFNGKSTLTRTTAERRLWDTVNRSRNFAHAQILIRRLTQCSRGEGICWTSVKLLPPRLNFAPLTN